MKLKNIRSEKYFFIVLDFGVLLVWLFGVAPFFFEMVSGLHLSKVKVVLKLGTIKMFFVYVVHYRCRLKVAANEIRHWRSEERSNANLFASCESYEMRLKFRISTHCANAMLNEVHFALAVKNTEMHLETLLPDLVELNRNVSKRKTIFYDNNRKEN